MIISTKGLADILTPFGLFLKYVHHTLPLCDCHSCFLFERGSVRLPAILTEGIRNVLRCLQTNVGTMCILKSAMTAPFHLFPIRHNCHVFDMCLAESWDDRNELIYLWHYWALSVPCIRLCLNSGSLTLTCVTRNCEPTVPNEI